MSASRILVVVPVLALASCVSLGNLAGARFSEEDSCPAERLVVTPRDDLLAHDAQPTRTPEPPPAEVAADPERLRVWQESKQRHVDEADRGSRVYQVEGCGHAAMYGCAGGGPHTSAGCHHLCGVTARWSDASFACPEGVVRSTPR